jgi:DNA-binding SARP family transcriptional activator
MTDYQILLFGNPRILAGERLIRISRRKSLALLIYVAISEVNPSRSRITGLFWPNKDESHARGALRTTLSSLNTELGETLLLSKGDYFYLKDFVRVDVNEFRQKILNLDKNNFFDQKINQELAEASDLYSGEFLSGFTAGRDANEFEDWQFMQKENLSKSFSRILERLVQSFTLTSNLEKAAVFAQKWTSHEPENENAHRRLIELYAWMGKKRQAMLQYEKCKSILKRNLNVEPEDSTIRLYKSIKENQLQIPEQMISNGPLIPAAAFIDNSVFYAAVLSVGLTNSAEKLFEQRPYDAASVVNILFHRSIEDILMKQSAYTWLILGDTLIALFGVPNAGNDDAYRAVISAIEILQTSSNYGFKMTAGIAMGLVYSRCGDSEYRNSSLIGPGVTSASVLRFFGDPGMIFVDSVTKDHIKGSVSYEKVEGNFPGIDRAKDVYKIRMELSGINRFI